jgi:hypothetical protein
MLKHEPILAEDYPELQVHRFECQLAILRCFCEDSLLRVKQFFLFGKVQENLSLRRLD